MKGIINTDYRTFLISYQFQSINGKFIVEYSQFVEALKRFDKNGISFIKEFRPEKNDFVRISKKELLQAFPELETHYYFK